VAPYHAEKMSLYVIRLPEERGVSQGTFIDGGKERVRSIS